MNLFVLTFSCVMSSVFEYSLSLVRTSIGLYGHFTGKVYMKLHKLKKYAIQFTETNIILDNESFNSQILFTIIYDDNTETTFSVKPKSNHHISNAHCIIKSKNIKDILISAYVDDENTRGKIHGSFCIDEV
jgi:hypothetical protein